MKDNQAKYPQLRFKGFTDPWEQDKLDYIFDILDGDRGKNYPSESDFLEEGPTLFLDTGNVRKNGFLFNTTKYITKERDCSLRSGKLQLFDFVLTSRGTLGNVAYYDKKTHVEYQSVRINSAMLILRPIRRNIFSDLYLKVVLHGNLIENFMKKNHVGSAQPHITKKDFSKMLVGIPSTFKEQEKIGSLFNNLDFLITLHQRKLAKLKELKQGYLQKLFPKNGSKFPQLRFAGFADAWEQRKFFDNIKATIDYRGRTPKKIGLNWSKSGYLALSALNVKKWIYR
nr:restriction endonuclease subunit S [Lactiplantibacillus plantarum]